MNLLKRVFPSIVILSLTITFSSCNNSDDIGYIVPLIEYPVAPNINLKTTWEKATGLESTGIQKIIQHKEILLASTIAKGVYSSKDNGSTWAISNTGVVDDNNTQLTEINTYDISSYNNSIYLITDSNIYLSKNESVSWQPTKFSSKGFISGGYRVCAIDDATICASSGSGKFIYNYSNDFGENWDFKSNDFGEYLLNYKVINNSVFATKSDKGIVSSTDKGITWSSIGLEDTRCYDFVMKTNFKLAATENGLYVYKNSEGWIKTNSFGLKGSSINNISTLIEVNNWLIALTVNNELYISKIIDEKVADWQQLELEGLEFIDSYMFISSITYSKGKLLIGTKDLNQIGQTSPTHGKGVYTAEISLN